MAKKKPAKKKATKKATKKKPAKKAKTRAAKNVKPPAGQAVIASDGDDDDAPIGKVTISKKLTQSEIQMLVAGAGLRSCCSSCASR